MIKRVVLTGLSAVALSLSLLTIAHAGTYTTTCPDGPGTQNCTGSGGSRG